MKSLHIIAVIACSLIACSKEKIAVQEENTSAIKNQSGFLPSVTASLGITGDAADVTTVTEGGTVLMGGGTDVNAAIQWMIQRSGGGDFVVLRATGTNAYNSYIYGLGAVNSVETILIDSRTGANDPAIEAKIRNAEALFITGGDQANYYQYWEGTKVEDAINYLRNTKKVPIGGTSAGCAIMGKIYFTAVNGTITTAEALANPYNSKLTLQRDNFISNPYLGNLITDTHFNNPDRRGRLITFMARMSKDYAIIPKGIGVDEATAVCIDKNGYAKVYGSGIAFFLTQHTTGGVPERCISGSSLDWYRSKQAIRAYKITGSTAGNGNFDLVNWTGSGGTSQYYYIDRGVLGIF
jgi:cyanophycinase